MLHVLEERRLVRKRQLTNLTGAWREERFSTTNQPPRGRRKIWEWRTKRGHVCVCESDLLLALPAGEQPGCGAAAGRETRSNGSTGDTWDADRAGTRWTRAPACEPST